jgi:hypothetical protein
MMSGRPVSVKGDEPFLFLFFICCTLVEFRAGPGLLLAWILVAVPKQGTKRDSQSGVESLSLTGDLIETTSVKQTP